MKTELVVALSVGALLLVGATGVWSGSTLERHIQEEKKVYKEVKNVYPQYYRFKGMVFRVDAPDDSGIRKVTFVK
jgi:hypothetical protein